MAPGSSGSRGRRVRDGLRAQLWPLPTLGVVLAVALGVGLPRLDARVDDDLSAAVTGYLFAGGAEAARAVLSAIAGSLITVTSLTFSLTVLTLQLASSQFSPRLLRTFSRDRVVHLTLALFVATFTYALTVLRTVRGEAEQQDAFVPQLSVTVAFGLALASVLALVLFLAHLARELRVETMLSAVHDDARDTLRRVLPELGEATGPAPALQAPREAVLLLARCSGFLVSADEEALTAAAADAGAVVLVDRPPGSWLVAGTPYALAWPADGARPLSGAGLERLAERVAAAVETGSERTSTQDVAFGLRQLTDVAVKALSPGINDPTTAVHALGHCSALLCELAGRDLRPAVLRDEHDQVRAVLARPSLPELLEQTVGQPRRYGQSEPALLDRLLGLLRELAWHARLPEHRHAVADQLAQLRSTMTAQDFHATELGHLDRQADAVEQALRGTWAVRSSREPAPPTPASPPPPTH